MSLVLYKTFSLSTPHNLFYKRWKLSFLISVWFRLLRLMKTYGLRKGLLQVFGNKAQRNEYSIQILFFTANGCRQCTLIFRFKCRKLSRHLVEKLWRLLNWWGIVICMFSSPKSSKLFQIVHSNFNGGKILTRTMLYIPTHPMFLYNKFIALRSLRFCASQNPFSNT